MCKGFKLHHNYKLAFWDSASFIHLNVFCTRCCFRWLQWMLFWFYLIWTFFIMDWQRTLFFIELPHYCRFLCTGSMRNLLKWIRLHLLTDRPELLLHGDSVWVVHIASSLIAHYLLHSNMMEYIQMIQWKIKWNEIEIQDCRLFFMISITNPLLFVLTNRWKVYQWILTHSLSAIGLFVQRIILLINYGFDFFPLGLIQKLNDVTMVRQNATEETSVHSFR